MPPSRYNVRSGECITHGELVICVHRQPGRGNRCTVVVSDIPKQSKNSDTRPSSDRHRTADTPPAT